MAGANGWRGRMSRSAQSGNRPGRGHTGKGYARALMNCLCERRDAGFLPRSTGGVRNTREVPSMSERALPSREQSNYLWPLSHGELDEREKLWRDVKQDCRG